MKVIGINGLRTSGKDTVCSMFIEYATSRYGLDIERQGFADALKLSAYRLFKPDCTLEEALAWCDDIKVGGYITWALDAFSDPAAGVVSGREFLQRFGTESHRDVFGQDFWLDAVLPIDESPVIDGIYDRARLTRDDCDVLIIPDVRFENEIERVKTCGGELWKIKRPGLSGDGHASEQDWPDEIFDLIIDNDGSLKLLGLKMVSHAERFLAAHDLHPRAAA